jgi:hypothetical protein
VSIPVQSLPLTDDISQGLCVRLQSTAQSQEAEAISELSMYVALNSTDYKTVVHSYCLYHVPALGRIF